MLLFIEPLLAWSLLAAAPPPVPSPDTTLWRVIGELAFTDVAGNRSLSLLSTKLAVSRRDPARLELRASAGLRYGRSDGELAVADYTFDLESRLTPERPISPFATFAANRDETRNLEVRVAVAAGVDLNLVRDTLAQVAVGLAVLQDYEAVSLPPGSADPANQTLTRLSLRFRAQLPIREGVSFRQQSMVQPVADHPEDYLLTTETAVAVLLSERLALQTSFTFNRDTSPPEGVLFRNDRTLTVGLVVNLH